MNAKNFSENERRDYREEILDLLRQEQDDVRLREALWDYHGNDLARAFEELNEEEQISIGERLGAELMAELLSYSEDAGELLAELEVEDAAQILSHMEAEDAVAVIEEWEDEEQQQVLSQMEQESRREIDLLNSYGEDEFGSRMSRNFISVKRGFTVKSAMRELIAQAAERDNIYTVFVTEEDGRFYGAIDLKELIVARGDDDPETLIRTAFPYVCDRDSVSDGAERLKGYSEELIPVLSESGILLGVITAPELIEIVDEEHGEDYARLAALTGEEERDDSLLRSLGKRLPWLVALLFMGLAVSWVVGLFEEVVSSLPLIVSFQSLILGMAGNVGTQSLAVTVRTLGGEESEKKRIRVRLILRETRIALFNGLCMGLIAFTVVGGYLWIFHVVEVAMILPTAGCVGIAMLFAMTVSGFTGAVIPILLERFGFDPAVASGPLITTVNDLVAVISYYSLAWGLLLNLAL